MNRGRVAHGFTIIELLVVIGVIGILIGLIVPSVGWVRKSAQNTTCLSNLRQLWAPVNSYMSINDNLLPNCEFLPAASATGPVGGLPPLLKRYIEQDSEAWFCPADIKDESREIGTSYFYLPGLLKYLPEVQLSALQFQMSHAPGSITQKQLERDVRALESRLVGNLIGNDPKRKYPLLLDSEDRHGSGRNPRNAVFIDGSAGEMTTLDEDDAEREAGEEGEGGGG